MPGKNSKKYPDKLFSAELGRLIWGVTNGGHVAHIIDFNEVPRGSFSAIRTAPKNIAANTGNVPDPDDDMEEEEEEIEVHASGAEDQPEAQSFSVKKVSAAEAFTNAGDDAAYAHFMNIAKQAFDAYARQVKADEKNKVSRESSAPVYEFLLAVKKYITAASRSGQQDALADVRKKYAKYSEFTKDKHSIDMTLQSIMNLVDKSCRGNLNYSPAKEEIAAIKEPSNTFTGAFGIWTKTDDALFPHGTASPNDVKQGYGVNDCFLLSVLTKIAQTNPDLIRNSMKDNGDGTVSVRYYDEAQNEDERMNSDDGKVPVVVTVKKTENKLAGVASVYASSAVWVQMQEKAYIKFLVERGKDVPGKPGVKYTNSFSSINFGSPRQVLNAFSKDKKYGEARNAFGFSSLSGKGHYVPGKKYTGAYSKHEEKFFDFLRDCDNNGDILIVGNSGTGKGNEKAANNVGIRTKHAYPIMKVFEKDGRKFVQLRDPYAMFRAVYDDNFNLVNDQAAVSGTFKAGLGNMGTFNLELRDFLTYFDTFSGITEDRAMELGVITDEWEKENAPAASDSSTASKPQDVPEEDWKDLDISDGKVTQTTVKNGQNETVPQSNDQEDDFEDLDENPNADQLKEEPETQPDAKEDEHSPADEFTDFEDDISGPKHKIDAFSGDISLKALLESPGGINDIRRVIAQMAEDLEATSMFFSYKNTRNFANMRDKLNRINENFKKNAYATDIDELETDLTDLSELAGVYAKSKAGSVRANLKKGKQPSPRAVHRLADAVTLMNLGRGLTQVAEPENAEIGRLVTIRNDIIDSYRLLNKSNKDTSRHLENAYKRLDKFIDSNPGMRDSMDELFEVNDNIIPEGLLKAAGKYKEEDTVSYGRLTLTK